MRTKTGIITSAKMTGTVTVTVHRSMLHPKYKKSFRVSKKYLVDPNGHEKLREGDLVLIGECKPISKNKHFRVVEILKKTADVSELKEEAGLENAMNREKKAPEEKKEVAKSTDSAEVKDTKDVTEETTDNSSKAES